MSDLARYLAGDNYFTRSASGIKRGLSALADSLVARSNEGTENMQAALSGVRVKPGAILTDAGYVMPDASGQADFSQVGLEREPDVLRALELFGSAMGPVKGATVAAKSGTGGKVAADVAHALPMDEASRMARAAEMGYHTNLYHGTGSDIPAFQDTRRGNWFTDRPEIANIYAEKSGPTGSDIRAINATADPNVMPVMLRGNVLEVSDLGPGGGGWSTDNIAQALGVKAEDFKPGNRMKELSDLARSKGYSAIKITDMNDLGGVQSQWKLIDPTAIRSRFAAFDPARADSADLLAARANLGPIVNALLQGYDRQ